MGAELSLAELKKEILIAEGHAAFCARVVLKLLQKEGFGSSGSRGLTVSPAAAALHV